MSAGELTDAGYEGGHACQLFFAEEAVLDSAKVAPYSTNTTERTTLGEDSIYPGNGAQGGLLTLKYKKGRMTQGVRASLTHVVGHAPAQGVADPADTERGDIGPVVIAVGGLSLRSSRIPAS